MRIRPTLDINRHRDEPATEEMPDVYDASSSTTERAARAVAPPQMSGYRGDVPDRISVSRRRERSEDGYPFVVADPESTALLECFNPARVLAECEAKRRIVELHSIGDGGIGKNGRWNEATQTMEPRQYWYCGNCDYDRDYGFVADEKEGCETLLLLAGVYSDHPDFDPAWEPA